MNMDPGTWSQRVAAAVRAEMTARRLTARALAGVLEVSEATARTRLEGQIPLDLVELQRVAAWLDTTPSELLARAGDPAA